MLLWFFFQKCCGSTLFICVPALFGVNFFLRCEGKLHYFSLFLAAVRPIAPASLLEKAGLPPLNCFALLSKTGWACLRGSISGFSALSHDLRVHRFAPPHRPDHGRDPARRPSPLTQHSRNQPRLRIRNVVTALGTKPAHRLQGTGHAKVVEWSAHAPEI